MISRMPGTILDMHVHTTAGASDSGLSPEDLAEEAVARGLTGVNITEHDRLWDAFKLKEYRERHSAALHQQRHGSLDRPRAT